MKNTQITTLDNLEMTKKDVPKMLSIVSDQIKAIRGEKKTVIKTLGEIPGFGISIKEISTVTDIIKAHSFIVAKERAFNASREALKLTAKNYTFKLGNYIGKTWIEHLEAHLIEVKNKTKLEELEKVKNILEANLSEDMKFAKQMGQMVDILKDLKVD